MSQSPAQSSIALPFLVFSTLLLALLIPDVIYRKPIMTPDVRQGWVMHHQVVQNLIIAQKIVASRLSAPTTAWSPDYQIGPVGRGIWFAQGTVKTITDPNQAPLFWKVLFIPDESGPLYLRIGDHEEGNYSSALKQAGLQPAQR